MKISKFFSIIICICLISPAFTNVVIADVQLEIGDYIQMGTYEGSPIIWRYVADDDNGKLMVSDRIICFKYYGPGGCCWHDSCIREWLNSNSVILSKYDNGEEFEAYGGELGFLSNLNQAELSIMKPVTQWTMVNSLELSENESTESYIILKTPGEYRNYPFDYIEPVYYNIEDIPNIYYGRAMQTTDKVFLLDEMQLYNMYQNFGVDIVSRHYLYFLRSRSGGITSPNRDSLTSISEIMAYGIRPAFYLNETAVSGMTGSGTAGDPYVLIPDPDYVLVEVNGVELNFDVAPVMESDRVLVPMRAIFEDLGATVEWEGETETVTATKDDTVITLQIDNNVMTKNGEEIILDVPARLVGDRTLVPIRAVAEGLDTTVDWIDEENKVVITK